jgi:hypothetical protein
MEKISLNEIEQCIFIVRKQKVMLDSDLAKIYGVETKKLNQAVKRNSNRFPNDFMFQLNNDESEFLRSQFVTSKKSGGSRYLPHVFTEHGALMLANILNSEAAAEASIQVVRSFVRLREMVISHSELSRKLSDLEKKYDSQFKVVFEAIHKLMVIPEAAKKKIGI